VEFSGILMLVKSGRFLGRRVNISKNLTLVKFSKIPRLVEPSGFLRYRVDSYRNFRLVDPSGFFKF